jgi:type VI secretion system secreted protein VgrG
MSYTQADRPIRIDTPLGEDTLLLESFSGAEYVSQPFRFQLEMVSQSASLALDDLLQKPAVVSLRMVGGEQRYFHGWIGRAVQGPRSASLITYRAELVPWLWFLSLNRDCRIFQNKTVPQIIEELLQDRGMRDYQMKLYGSYQPCEYCVQYRESDLSFISRLMEDEGIFYFFQHSKDRHTLIMTDAQSAFAHCPGNHSIRYDVTPTAGEEEDVIHSLDRNHAVATGTVSLTDYNFETPSMQLDVKAKSKQFEIYDYPGNYSKRSDGERVARIRLQELDAGRLRVSGTSNCRQFIPGYRFQVREHYRSDANAEYVLLKVEHRAATTSYRSDAEEPFQYKNSFEAIPFSIQYRPPRATQAPVVRGVQTAVVAGKKGEEIWVDEYGRVKVQFHWDREGKRDENSSCWLRVSQIWAGKGWGGMWIPRIDQEVIVEFLEGDPDRPIITGRVYNGGQMPPYKLPDERTQAGVKSRSSKDAGPDNFNEIRFEDKTGQELLVIHAERNLQQYVEKGSYEYVGVNRHLVVDGSQLEAVGGNQHLTVKGEKREKIGSDVSLDIAGDCDAKVGLKFALESGEEIHIKGGMKVVIEAGMQLSLIGPGGFVDISPAGVTIQGTMVLINSGGSHGSGSGASPEAPKWPVKAEE